jgi:hypothetical protein
MKTYSELILLPTFQERFDYLTLHGVPTFETFGYARQTNQIFYKSTRWRNARNKIIMRDDGNDLALEGFQIQDKLLVHHLNPLTLDDILNDSSRIYDPENLVCVSHDTHNGLHYGNIPKRFIYEERQPGDTRLW